MNEIKTGDKELRAVLADTLQELMENNPDIMYLEADLGGAIKTAKLLKEMPNQAIDIGIMEANMVGVAAGMSVKGKIPFVHSFGTFATRRCADQVFLSGCYNKANVKILGSDPGVCAEANGGTHMPLEDMAVFRAFPEMTILDIAEPNLLKFAMKACTEYYGMTYIRFPRKLKDYIYDEKKDFQIGKGIVLKEGKDVTIAASGIEVYEAVKAGEMLAGEGIEAEIIDMFTVKPIDKELLISSAAKTGAVVSAENHNIIGGLGSAVAEVLSENYPVPLMRIGSRDRFGQVGDKNFLMERFGMTAEDIVKAAKSVIEKKAALTKR